MDALAQMQQELAMLRQQNEQLRVSRDQANSQAGFLRNQQAMQGLGQDVQSPNMQAHDWFAELGFGQTQPTTPTPPPEQKVTLTLSELKKFQEDTLRKSEQRSLQQSQQFYAQVTQAQNTQQALQRRLVAEHPDLARDFAPVIYDVWNAKQLEMKGKTPDEIYAATIEKTRGLVNLVSQKVGGQAGAGTTPYDVGGIYGAEMPPWAVPQQPQPQTELYQAMPGNQRAEWRPEIAELNRYRQSKALHTYTPVQNNRFNPRRQQQQQG